jgi:hypothetical protein
MNRRIQRDTMTAIKITKHLRACFWDSGVVHFSHIKCLEGGNHVSMFKKNFRCLYCDYKMSPKEEFSAKLIAFNHRILHPVL